MNDLEIISTNDLTNDILYQNLSFDESCLILKIDSNIDFETFCKETKIIIYTRAFDDSPIMKHSIVLDAYVTILEDKWAKSIEYTETHYFIPLYFFVPAYYDFVEIHLHTEKLAEILHCKTAFLKIVNLMCFADDSWSEDEDALSQFENYPQIVRMPEYIYFKVKSTDSQLFITKITANKFEIMFSILKQIETTMNDIQYQIFVIKIDETSFKYIVGTTYEELDIYTSNAIASKFYVCRIYDFEELSSDNNSDSSDSDDEEE